MIWRRIGILFPCEWCATRIDGFLWHALSLPLFERTVCRLFARVQQEKPCFCSTRCFCIHSYRSFDILLGIGAGVEFRNHYRVELSYDYGLLNRMAVEGSTTHRGLFKLGLAYAF